MDKTGGQQIEVLPVAGLAPYDKNARTHSATQIKQIAASIEAFGFVNPVLVDDAGGIIAGHGRVLAARGLGMTEVPCLRIAHLSDAQRRAYIIADNKLAEGAGWEMDLLTTELEALEVDLPDLLVMGFGKDELAKLLDFDLVVETSDESDGDNPPAKKMLTCPKCGFKYE